MSEFSPEFPGVGHGFSLEVAQLEALASAPVKRVRRGDCVVRAQRASQAY